MATAGGTIFVGRKSPATNKTTMSASDNEGKQAQVRPLKRLGLEVGRQGPLNLPEVFHQPRQEGHQD